MMKNVEENNNKLFLFEMFHEIQDELHKSDKQLIECKYNNKLEYIKFKKNQRIGMYIF